MKAALRNPLAAAGVTIRIEIRDAAEFAQTDRLTSMRIAIERQNATTGPASIHDLLRLDLRSIANAQVLGIAIIVVHADDVRRRAFPAIIANDQTIGIQRLRQMVKRCDCISRSWNCGQIRYAP